LFLYSDYIEGRVRIHLEIKKKAYVKDFIVDEEMACLCLEFLAYELKIGLRVS